jgi:hypothetical protein
MYEAAQRVEVRRADFGWWEKAQRAKKPKIIRTRDSRVETRDIGINFFGIHYPALSHFKIISRKL